MKIIYSYLQKFLPDLKVEPHILRDDLTMIGHFTNFFEEINDEIVFDLDIKVNRGDCLGYYGLAKDLSVFYQLPLKNLSTELLSDSKHQLPIQVSTDKVKRIMAVKISELKNQCSPLWLKNFLKCHNTKSINTIVDLTNYIMFLYGIPSHAFDVKKTGENLLWQINSEYKDFISLDSSKLILDKSILIINNQQKLLSLSFWGGQICAIDSNTNEAIIEMAIYDPATVRQNSRQLKSVTEASIRLEKDLDSEMIPIAFNHLVTLINQECQGYLSSQVFDYYPSKELPQAITFDYSLPSTISGIDIPKDFIVNCFKNLGCQINDTLVTPPSIRKDISIEADLVEEALRFWGYHKIPQNEALAYKDVGDITPKELYLIENIKDKLINLGYDEVLTWPLVTTPFDEKTVIKTQNSINSEAIYLRQSLIPSLAKQRVQYHRLKLMEGQFFEIGKIFHKINNSYVENYSLAIYHHNSQQLQKDLQTLALTGKVYDGNFVEIILDNLQKPEIYLPQQIKNTAVELTSQIITLDANILLPQKEDPQKLIEKYSNIIGQKYLWKLVITDIYQDIKNNNYRYTFKASYFNLDDKTAKSIHLKSFDLL